MFVTTRNVLMSKQKHHPNFNDSSQFESKQEQRRCEVDLDGLALGLADGSPLAALDGPWEVRNGDDEEGVAADTKSVHCS